MTRGNELRLQDIPLFSQVEPDHEPVLRKLLTPVTLAPGQILFRQGDLGDALWVLGAGVEVEVLASAQGAREPQVLARACQGETLGEMSLVDDGRRSATAMVRTGGPAHQIQAEDFAPLRDGREPAAFAVLRRLCVQLAQKLRATSNRVAPLPPTASPDTVAPGRHPTEEELLAFPPFFNLPQVVKLALAQKLTVQDFRDGARVFSEGDPADSAYLVAQGGAAVIRGATTLSELSPGTLLGLVALLDHGPRSATCVARGDTRLLRLSRADFELLFNASNRFAFDIVDLISKQLVAHLRATNELVPSVELAVPPLELDMVVTEAPPESLPL
jgi:CRP-like cAMP-binding protein